MTESNKATEQKEVLDAHTEFECKYRVEPHTLIEFKKIVSQLPDPKRFLYVEGPDRYYIHPDMDENSFCRYRKPSFGLDGGRSELTLKQKPKGAKNSIQRIELNIRVDQTPEDTIEKFVETLGFKFNFSIVKNCHIMFFEDANVVFYTVYDTTEGTKTSKVDHFVEIEVNEDNIRNDKLTEDQAWAIISKYEKILEPIGITAYKRLRRSLWEMYKR